MRIKNVTHLDRFDFTAIYVCEKCGNTQEEYRYNDDNFHKNEIQKMKCKKCGYARQRLRK